MSIALKRLDWDEQIKLALDPQKAAAIHARQSTAGMGCSMCGDFCAMDLVGEYLGVETMPC